jgi:hypothetical protein
MCCQVISMIVVVVMIMLMIMLMVMVDCWQISAEHDRLAMLGMQIRSAPVLCRFGENILRECLLLVHERIKSGRPLAIIGTFAAFARRLRVSPNLGAKGGNPRLPVEKACLGESHSQAEDLRVPRLSKLWRTDVR